MILTGRKTRGRGTSVLWLTARAALGAGSGGGDVGVREVAATYHVPISNTATGIMLLEPAG
jgi:protocatechuate 4,5-dioxygenase beta chain